MGAGSQGIQTGPRATRQLVDDLVRGNLGTLQWFNIDLGGNWSEVLVGTGSTLVAPKEMLVASNGTASSTAIRRFRGAGQTGFNLGKAADVINWDKLIVVQFVISSFNQTTNGQSRVTLGKDADDGVGDLDNRGIGILIDNLAITGKAHDGSSLASPSLSTSLVDNVAAKVVIVSDGLGNVEWLMDTDGAGLVSKATTASGPTGDGVAQDNMLHLEAANNADSANQDLVMHELKIMVGQ